MAGFVELTIDQGATFKTQLELKNDVGESLDLTNYSLSGQVRRAPSSGNATANLICTKVDAVNGIIQIGMSAANTANIRFGRYVFDVEASTVDETIRLIEGMVTVTPGVTKT
jgi:hypothetical protein